MYYAYDPSDLEVGFDPRTKAKNITVSGRNVKSVMLAGLRACESYVAKIAVTAPGICPLSNIETFHTGEGKTPVCKDRWPMLQHIITAWTLILPTLYPCTHFIALLSDIEAQPENLKFEFFKDSKTTGNLTWDAACSEEFLPVVCYFWKMVKFQNVDIHLIFSTLYIFPDVILYMLDVYTCTSILKGWFTFSPIVNSAW